MIEKALRWIAIVLSLLVGVSFVLFAVDRASGASQRQQGIVSGDGAEPGSLPQPTRHRQPRRFIDGAARALLSPFTGVVTSSDVWLRRLIPTVIALLLYGVGLGFLARYARGLP